MSEHPARMLVVDDDPFNRTVLATGLEEQGHEASTAADGLEALERLRTEPFDLVLLDLVMPEMDGFEVLTRIKSSPELMHLPVIVVSGLDEMQSVVRCIELGAADYLPKPCDPVLLRARISGCLAAKRMHDMKAAYVREIETLADQLKVRNHFIKETFGRYLSDAVVAELLDSPAGLRFGGEKRTVTMLLADLRGFSPMAERLSPEQVVRVINNFLGAMADVIFAWDGTIDEFIGDSILCFFGAPVARDDDALRAVACSLQMQQAMGQVNRANRAAGLPHVEMGIAVHTGDVVVGNIGCEKRAKYGAVGSHVNLAARIEACSVGGQILVSEAALRAAGPDVLTGESIAVQVKGFPEPVRAHDLVGLAGRPDLRIERPEEVFVPLERPLPVLLTRLEGKRSSRERIEADLTALSRQSAEVAAGSPLEPLSNLTVRLVGPDGTAGTAEAYAKVQNAPQGASGPPRIRFTWAPPEVQLLLAELLRHAGSPA